MSPILKDVSIDTSPILKDVSTDDSAIKNDVLIDTSAINMDDLIDNWVPNNDQDDEEIQAKQIIDNVKGLIRPSATSPNLKSDLFQVQNEEMNSQVRNAFLMFDILLVISLL